MRPDSQSARLLAWLRANPGASSYEITVALHIVNVTGRVSDLRAAGHDVRCSEDKEGVARYVVHEPVPEPVTGVQVALFFGEA
jgi:hypothetical protein